MNFLLFPPIAFILYLGLGAILLLFGRFLTKDTEKPEETSAYASGEASPSQPSASGYRMFSEFALYFAVLHLGVLLLATSGTTWLSLIFLLFLLLLLLVKETV